MRKGIREVALVPGASIAIPQSNVGACNCWIQELHDQNTAEVVNGRNVEDVVPQDIRRQQHIKPTFTT